MFSSDDCQFDRMRQQHLQQVVALHERCFPGYYLTDLGRSFLRAMYRWHVESPEAIAHVALAGDGSLAGFVAGTVDYSSYRRSLFRRTWWRMGVALGKRFVSNPALTARLIGERSELVWQAIASIVPRRNPRRSLTDAIASEDLRAASLVSIAVEPSARRFGIGKALSELFVREAWNRGCERITLSVRDDNVAARAFYESMNWEEVSRSSNRYRGSFSVTYQKVMRDEQEE